ncbi:MAG: hypothetical protein M1812_004067 [Candelaria pacifica]|nr:MAG: hypothetical protein M1812_004067 [Candelaria pacifica]
MAPTSTALTTKVTSGSPYQLDQSQTLKASGALLKHIKSDQAQKEVESKTKNLLANADEDSDGDEADVDIWLIISTKKHIVDKTRLKPGKIRLPHSLNASAECSICLITADPQRAFKDTIAHASFPTPLSTRITRIIGLNELKKQYKSYESRRQLLNEHDIFLADDRIVTQLPHVLGKIFYKGGAKRPVPVSIAAPKKNRDSGKAKENGRSVASPTQMGNEIERTLAMGLVQLSPSASTSIRVGKSGWPAEKLAENIEATVQGLVDKFVTKGWRNIKAVHIKGPNTMALPIWLADELWVDEQDVLEDQPVDVEGTKPTKALEGAKAESRKRKARDTETAGIEPSKKSTKTEGHDIAKEISLRKEKLRKQKEEAIREVEGEAVPLIMPKSARGPKIRKDKARTVSVL